MTSAERLIEEVEIELLRTRAALSGVSIVHLEESADAEDSRIVVAAVKNKGSFELPSPFANAPPKIQEYELTIEVIAVGMTAAAVDAWLREVEQANEVGGSSAGLTAAVAPFQYFQILDGDTGEQEASGHTRGQTRTYPVLATVIPQLVIALNGSIASVSSITGIITPAALLSGAIASQSVISGAITAVTPFSPSDIAGLKLWLKADSLALANNDPVTTWTDSSGLGNHATQATVAKKPTFKTAIVNGKPVIRFDGADDVLACPAITAASGLTGFCVGKVTVALPYQMMFVIQSGFVELRGNGTGAITDFLTNGLTAVTGGASTAWHVHSFGNNGTNLSQFWTDGVSNGTQPNSAACGTPSFGDRVAGGGPLNGDIAEVLLYDTLLSTPNRQAVELYLKTKFATP